MRLFIGRITDNDYTFYFYKILYLDKTSHYSFRFTHSSSKLYFEYPYVHCDFKSCLIASYSISHVYYDLFNPLNQLGLQSSNSAPLDDLIF